MDLVLISALDENRVIGKDGTLPWHYPKDLQHFKTTTQGHPVIMGRVTYESIASKLGGGLPNRHNIVLTSGTITTDDSNVTTASSLTDAVEQAEQYYDTRMVGTRRRVYVIGGASVYEQFLPYADLMILTEIHDTYEGDAYFPEWSDTRWMEVHREEHSDLSFVTYESRSAAVLTQ